VFSKVLIANRGEIALRIIRACKELGVSTVAVYSEADADALHVRFADEAICIGPPPSPQSYLDYRRVVSAAEITGADAIHPGYGFLAENAEFAEVCIDNGFTFIGPTPDSIRRMGDKSLAKETMRAAGVPVTPGSDGAVETIEDVRTLANEMGYPVILKASAGGGGKGMRVVNSEDGIESAFTLAQAEAVSFFNNPELYLEKYIINPRHIEIQLLGDGKGKAVHLGERDCSIQRRHQKLIEESPSPAVSEELRLKLGEAAVKGAEAVNYLGAGTMEFLLTQDGEFYFMEMNTRIQVEHPVTEEVTGIDILREQIKIAAGEPFELVQEEILFKRCAMEFRINAEDPSRNFLPSPGTISTLNVPGGFGVRVDTHVYAGYRIPPNYDSLIAKLIIRGDSREEVLARAKRALEEFVVEGVETTVPFHLEMIETEEFRTGNFSTFFLDEWMAAKNSH
jgi:acetyl-CoA carboxylase, biotin carboxylase subunit